MPLVGMRIGIFTGPMVAGTIGDAQRLEYNVHGDTVNTAARLESFDKANFAPEYLTTPCRILVGEVTAAHLGDGFELERVGEELLKGKAQPVGIFRVHRRRVD
jgi:adenylate cyclase